jgi:hypothetical protein
LDEEYTDNATLILLTHFSRIRVRRLETMAEELSDREKRYRTTYQVHVNQPPVMLPSILSIKDLRI